ncbi:MAG TPA: tetratricopeptide repeat-containing glycosyltransferase family protein [Acetobacteraceae bacterium]|jgi:hypothetical protein|nr:tetratricopeptide repeat-containing glycosyltransferase family protein [Acetobacteraceae bacterium]
MSDYAELMLQWAQQAYERGQHAEADTLLRLLQGDPVEAEFLLQSATELDGLHARAHDELGQALEKPGRHDEARESRMCAMELDPELAKLRMIKSFEALHKGDHATLWEEYESRVIAAPDVIPKRRFPRPRWYGDTDISGKTILLHAEQGHGDAIQFLRYIPLVAARDARIVVEIHRPLLPFVAAMSEVAELRELGEPLPDFDVHRPLMSLPPAFQTTLETIPADIPYLQVPSDRMARWRRRFGLRRRVRVGIAWSGNPDFADDTKRSTPLADFARILDRPDCDLHVIQNDVQKRDEALLDGLTHLSDHSTLFGDFADTAAVISLLDLVISVDTSVAQLAGALGWPTWLLLAEPAEWRWMADREDSPWCPTMWLFRQQAEGDWGPVLERVGRELTMLLAEAHDPDAA